PGSGRWDAAVGHAAEAVRTHVEPEGDIHATADYRAHLARVLSVRALSDAVRDAMGRVAP
ncbi:MAG: hypothetical protein ABIZ49_11240, partial [Opitutaceae bacterium]